MLRASQIGSLRRQLALQLTQQPLALDFDIVRNIGFTRLRQHLVPQYARLNVDERRLWLTNFSFVLTPTLQTLISEIRMPYGTTAVKIFR